MSALTTERFAEFYRAASLAIAETEVAAQKKRDPAFEPKKVPTAKDPFPWHKRLSQRVSTGDWPQVIAMPTASGKTTCIDIAIFALACHAPKSTRRLFFVVDRRIVVDQAYEHAKALAHVLERATAGILREVADSLRDVARPGWAALPSDQQNSVLRSRWSVKDTNGPKERRQIMKDLSDHDWNWIDTSPLDVYALRGGMYRETTWARSPLQPTVIASTVDQVGSRLLFRGYGVSDSMKPIHAGLVGNDSLILLDEAHCSKPFDQTVRAVERYREWGEAEGRPPFRLVTMTATPGDGIPECRIIRDDDEDRKPGTLLGDRIAASKPAKLVVAEKATGKKAIPELVKELAKQARELAKEAKAVGIIVNRVATARLLEAELGEEAILLTGRMRPIDRDELFENRLRPLLSNAEGDPPQYVIGTQCLEVGADFDFHALVTECASLDALRQRFGRLNRVAARDEAKAVIVVRADQQEPVEDEGKQDPVYGNSLANTWMWLNEPEPLGEVDFGVAAMRQRTADLLPERLASLNAPALDAPVLFPAHIDCWVQTNPRPMPDPDPALFLHGQQSGIPDVQVVFRGDLGKDADQWADIVSLRPPSSSEALPVRIDVFRKWLAAGEWRDESSDVEGERVTDTGEELESSDRAALRWKGPADKRTAPVSDPKKVVPGDTYVVSTTAGAESLGDFPNGTPTDHGDRAFQRSRDKAILRLLDLKLDSEDDSFESDLTNAILSVKKTDDYVERAIEYLSEWRNRRAQSHPLGGWVVTGKKRLYQFDPTFLEDDESAAAPDLKEVTLDAHSLGVKEYARQFASACHLPVETYVQAGLFHDIGKLDPRFQAMLQGRSPRTITLPALAKSDRLGGTPRERKEAWLVHRYPKGGRHELLSVALVAKKSNDDLLLHLIATHHGSARPFADRVEENDFAVRSFRCERFGQKFEVASTTQDTAAWNADLPERFWRVVHRYGWWGAAYREAVFRLADHIQSGAEQEERWEEKSETVIAPFRLPVPSTPVLQPVELIGLDGSNPLGFLAALGLLRVISSTPTEERPVWLNGPVKLAWGSRGTPSTAVLYCSITPTDEEFVEFLAGRLIKDSAIHPSRHAVALMRPDATVTRDRLIEVLAGFTNQRAEAFDWTSALYSELAPTAASQLLMVRRDYLGGNVVSVLARTTPDHLRRSLFKVWDYGDALDNQSLHWEPSEDRRHAYQWHEPNGDPTRKKRGGMLGANRLALEAWPLFQSVPVGDKLSTRSFLGLKANSVLWSWPLWSRPLDVESVGSLLALPALQGGEKEQATLPAFGITQVFRSRRILVGKTPNLTPAMLV